MILTSNVSLNHNTSNQNHLNSNNNDNIDTNNNNRASDRYIEDGSYLRIKNIQLGYSLSDALVEKLGFSQIRAYMQVKNALTLTEYSGYDPEISNGGVLNTGIDIGTYPQPRIWSMGLNIKF